MAKTGLLPVSVSKVLLEFSLVLPAFAWGYFCLVAAADLSSCHRNHIVYKQKVFTIWPFTGSSSAPGLHKTPGLSRTLIFSVNPALVVKLLSRRQCPFSHQVEQTIIIMMNFPSFPLTGDIFTVPFEQRDCKSLYPAHPNDSPLLN